MTIDKEFHDHLEKIKHYREHADWKDFFKVTDELEQLSEDINNEMHEDPSDTSKLDVRAQSLTKKLDDNKEEIAKKTKTQEEYDAVFNAVDYLDNHFNYKK